jgi:hypothetical protein
LFDFDNLSLKQIINQDAAELTEGLEILEQW